MTRADPSSLALSMHAALQHGTKLLQQNLAGITEAEARSRPRSGINNLVWVVGHTAYWRHHLADLAGVDGSVALPALELFRGQERRPAPSTGETALAEVVGLFDAATSRLDEAFAVGAFTGGPPAFLARAGKTLVHDAYHIGQASLLRRLVGHPGAI